MMILGIDASPSTTGFALYDSVNSDFVYIGKVRTSICKKTPTSAMRRRYICAELSHILMDYPIDEIVIEDVFINQLSSALPLSMLRGAIEQTVFDLGYDRLHYYSASQVKKIVAGHGQASKEDMFQAIILRFKDSKVVHNALGTELKSKNNKEKNEDMADACGVAVSFSISPDLAEIA